MEKGQAKFHNYFQLSACFFFFSFFLVEAYLPWKITITKGMNDIQLDTFHGHKFSVGAYAFLGFFLSVFPQQSAF